jgi:hypothetical protein
MSQSDMEAELERLRAENAQLKSKDKGGISLKVSEKGAVSLYGMGRFPVTLYKEQWHSSQHSSDRGIHPRERCQTEDEGVGISPAASLLPLRSSGDPCAWTVSTCYTLNRQDEEYFGGLKERVLERDEYRRRVCGAPGRVKRSIIVHHRVAGVSKFDLMISLCPGCRAKALGTIAVLSAMPAFVRIMERTAS